MQYRLTASGSILGRLARPHEQSGYALAHTAAEHKTDRVDVLATLQQMQRHVFSPMPAASDQREDVLASKKHGSAPVHAAPEHKTEREDVLASMQQKQQHAFAPMPAAYVHRTDVLASMHQNGFAPVHGAAEHKANCLSVLASTQHAIAPGHAAA